MTTLTVLDCNNFWSPTGGGVKRYHEQKLRHLADYGDINYVFMMPDTYQGQEILDGGRSVEHIPSVKEPGTEGYRYVLSRESLRNIIERHAPDIIEIGSPLVLPWLIRGAITTVNRKPALVGFWHDDFPRTHIGRPLRTTAPWLQRTAERVGWEWMRRAYAPFDAMFVASRRVGENMARFGLNRQYYTPLGVDFDRFDPRCRDGDLVERLKAGNPERLSIFFPHRLSDEKGLSTLIAAYPEICRILDHEPALVFAGVGPGKADVQALADRYQHVQYLGYLTSQEELAYWYASCDISIALSAFETFGLSAAEAMASGTALVGADEGAVSELIEQSDCGLTIPYADTSALVTAVVKMFREGDLAKRGLRGRQYVERFSWASAIENEVACYRDVLMHVRSGCPVPVGMRDLLTDRKGC